MADSTIPVTGSGGQQTPSTDASLQAGTNGGALNNGISSGVQPVVTGDQLTTNEGISLNQTALTTVSLGSPSNTAPEPIKSTNDFNPVILVVGIAFLLLAAFTFQVISQSSKKHN